MRYKLALLLMLTAFCPVVMACSNRDAQNAEAADMADKLKRAMTELAELKSQANVTQAEALVAGITLDQSKDVEFGSGLTTKAWRLHVHLVKELNVELYIARNGTTELVQSGKYQWNEWPDAEEPQQWRLQYAMQTGRVFGAANVRAPSFAVDFGDMEVDTGSNMRSSLTIDGDLTEPAMMSSTQGTLGQSPRVIYCEVYKPTGANEQFEYSDNLEAIAQAATDGRVFIALQVAWTPMEDE